MRYESVFPLYFHRRLKTCEVRTDQNGTYMTPLLEAVLLELETSDKKDWKAIIQNVDRCLSEMKTVQAYRKGRSPSLESLERAILNTRAMRVAVKQGDRGMALQMGRAAFWALSKA